MLTETTFGLSRVDSAIFSQILVGEDLAKFDQILVRVNFAEIRSQPTRATWPNIKQDGLGRIRPNFGPK